MVRLEPRPLDDKNYSICEFPPETIPGLNVTSIVSSTVRLINCRSLAQLSDKEGEKLEQPVSEPMMNKIYECLKHSDKISQKALNLLIAQGKVKDE
jgi:hypothetical protein